MQANTPLSVPGDFDGFPARQLGVLVLDCDVEHARAVGRLLAEHGMPAALFDSILRARRWLPRFGDRIDAVLIDPDVPGAIEVVFLLEIACGITAGPDGNLWFTEYGGNSPGNLWFTELQGNIIARGASDATVTEFAIPTPKSLPYGIAIGSDGNVWFTEFGGNKIGRLIP